MAKLDKDHYAGCLVGGAVGDALGAPTEFMNLRSIMQQYGPEGVKDYIEFSDGRGEITDDTQMLLFTAEGLLRSQHRAVNRGIGGAYKQICYQSYLRWLHTQDDWYGKTRNSSHLLDGWLLDQKFLYQRRAPGNTCLSALRSNIPGTIERPINDSKGCGGVMRIAPVGLLLHHNAENAFEIGSELAAMTHGHTSGYLSAGFLAAMICYINNGYNLIDSIEASCHILTKHMGHEETLQAINSALNLSQMNKVFFQDLESLGGGWVGEEALSISLYCSLSYPDDFEKAIILSINHSGDTDSTGSITGNILGLLLGENAIPQRWVNKLHGYEVIKQVALDLHEEVRGNGYDHLDEEWHIKYPPG
jgi:ADP-ribosylglycohydrolase